MIIRRLLHRIANQLYLDWAIFAFVILFAFVFALTLCLWLHVSLSLQRMVQTRAMGISLYMSLCLSSSFSLYLQKGGANQSYLDCTICCGSLIPSPQYWGMHLFLTWDPNCFCKNCCLWRIALIFAFFLDGPVFHHPINKEILHSNVNHPLLLADTFTSISRDALPSLSGPPAIM